MAKITRFKEYSFTESMVDDFIKSFDINEKVYDDYEPEVKEILNGERWSIIGFLHIENIELNKALI